MSLENVIAATPDSPATVATLARDLRGLGVQAESTLMVHSSLSALGYVVGGAPAVIDALSRGLGRPRHSRHADA
jgi:aminoglycoside 3-N-acetyltransferase